MEGRKIRGQRNRPIGKHLHGRTGEAPNEMDPAPQKEPGRFAANIVCRFLWNIETRWMPQSLNGGICGLGAM